MQNSKGQSASSCSLTGMDLFAPGCHDLKAFKRLLLTGQNNEIVTPANSESAASDQDEMITSILDRHGIREPEGKNLNPYERLLALSVRRALQDAGSTGPAIILVHLPQRLNKDIQLSLAQIAEISGVAVSQDQSAVSHADFSEVLEDACILAKENAPIPVALCSFFALSRTNEAIQNESSIGAACVVLSGQPVDEVPAYADIHWQADFNDRATQADAENYALSSENGTYPHVQTVPIIQMMQSALSLNNRMRFPQRDLKADPSSSQNQRLMRPWFPLPYTDKRKCHVNLPGDGMFLMEKRYRDALHPDHPFLNYGLHLLPLAFNEASQAVEKIEGAIKDVYDTDDLEAFIQQALGDFSRQDSAGYALSILGATRQDILNELQRARQDVPAALESGRDWQTPAGSYFTPNPFGAQEKIAFVYPGAFGTYVGMGREIFYLFPGLYESLQEVTEDPGKTINENIIFPAELTPEIQEQLQDELNGNPTEMISSGVCFSHLFTVILRDILNVHPQAVFGYSLGENSMMFGTGLWTQADGMRTSLEASPIFHERVSGRQNAIREYWGLPDLPENSDNSQSIWANYVLMTPVEKVKEALEQDERVYLTHINTPRQVVIGGDPQACQRIAQSLKCMHLQAPYHHAIHCAPIASEFDAFARMHDWPVESEPDIPVYSAADYAPLRYDSKSIADSFAKMLTNPIDFPKLVELAYNDGARIFIELGAGSNCSKWVEAVLKGKPFVSMSINQNNTEDHVSILKLIARLASQRIPMDLQVLGRITND